jgi:O-antigen ligase
MILFYFLVSVMPFLDPPLLHYLTGDATFKLLGALCALYAAFYVSQRKVLPSYFATWQSRFIVLFYLIAALSFLTKSRQTISDSPLISCTSFMILLFVTVSVVDSLQRLRWVLLSAAAAVGFGSIWVIREWISFRNVYPDFRPGWSVGDSNYFATSAVLCLPFMFLHILSGDVVRWEKRLYTGALLITIVAITLCASRGGFLGLMAAFFVFVWRSRRRLRNLTIISVLLLVPTLALPNSPVRRLLQPNRSDRESSENRIAAWKAAKRMIAAHPLAGIGLGNFKTLMPMYTDPGVRTDTIGHNAYLEVAAEMGIPQLAVFLAILFFSYQSLEQTRRRVQHSGPKLLSEAALGLEAGLVGYAVGALTISAEYQKLFWLILCLSMCLPALARDIVPADEKPAFPEPNLKSRRTPAWQQAIGSLPKRGRSGESSIAGGSPSIEASRQPEGRRASSSSRTDTLARFSERSRRLPRKLID